MHGLDIGVQIMQPFFCLWRKLQAKHVQYSGQIFSRCLTLVSQPQITSFKIDVEITATLRKNNNTRFSLLCENNRHLKFKNLQLQPITNWRQNSKILTCKV